VTGEDGSGEDGTGAASTDGAPGAAPTGAASIRRKRPATLTFTQTMLLLETFVVLFATLVSYGLGLASPAVVWGAGGGLCVLLLVLAGLQRRSWGPTAGSAAQVLVLACGFVVPMMWFIGFVFVVLWVVLLRLGRQIDRERAEFDAAHPDAVEPLRRRLR